MRRPFDVLDGEDVIALFLSVAGPVVEGLALSKQYFQNGKAINVV